MMLHNHARFGNKMFSVIQKISSEQTFTDILNLYCDLDLERSNPVFPQDTLFFDAVPSPRSDLDIEHSEPFFF